MKMLMSYIFLYVEKQNIYIQLSLGLILLVVLTILVKVL